MGGIAHKGYTAFAPLFDWRKVNDVIADNFGFLKMCDCSNDWFRPVSEALKKFSQMPS